MSLQSSVCFGIELSSVWKQKQQKNWQTQSYQVQLNGKQKLFFLRNIITEKQFLMDENFLTILHCNIILE